MGYDFLALSDHNIPPDHAGLDPEGMLLVPANEVSTADGHVLAVGTAAAFERDVAAQATIAAVKAAGGLAILCHPNWQARFNHFPYEKLEELTDYDGVEVFNGSIVEENGSAAAADKWDRLLSTGRTAWGLATDDSHRPAQIGRGWCVARAAERSVEAVLAALRAGSFYASTGVEIERLEAAGDRLLVHAPGAEALAAIGEHGARFAWSEGEELVCEARQCPGSFFRVECWGRADRKAWTQPFIISGK